MKVGVIAPLLCSKNLPSSVVCSRFLDARPPIGRLGGPAIVLGPQVVFVLLLSSHSHLLVCVPCHFSSPIFVDL